MAVLKPLYERVSGGYRTAKEDDIILSDNAPISIEDGSITEAKLAPELDDKINGKVNKSGDTITGNLNMSEQKIVNLGNGTNERDAVNKQQLDTKADISSLADVATSGNYSDLSGTPTIPTNNNQLTNGAGYITSEDIPDVSGVTTIVDPTTATAEDVANKINELITALQS